MSKSVKARSQLEKANKAAEDPETKKKLEDSLEYCKEQLRDAYMTFKDLKQRCVIDMDNWKEREDKVFYFKPDSFLLDKPEQQNIYREQLINRICGMPKPEPINNIADELHRQSVQMIADQSTPKLTKRNLAAYFQRRQYQLQHMKYKLLCRWAHFALTAEQLDKTSLQATQMLGKLEYNLEQAMNRQERLSQDDGYDQAKPQNRPHTKAEEGDGNLYVENDVIKPQSLIREDDVEVYLRGTSYRGKLLKVMNKFLSRLKWLPLQSRYEVYESALIANKMLIKRNKKRQKEDIKKIQARMRRLHTQKKTILTDKAKGYNEDANLKMSPELEAELKEIVDSLYISKHKYFCLDKSEKIQSNWRADHEIVPDFVNNIYLLKVRITETALLLEQDHGDIEVDQGYSYAYGVSTQFPSFFQKQIIKSQFSLYDPQDLGEKDKNNKQKVVLGNIAYVDSNIFRDIYTVKNECPSDEALKMEVKKEDIKVLRLKGCGYWIDYVCLVPTQNDWDKKQEGILNNNNPIDSLIVNGMNLLDANDLATVSKINEELALLHQSTVKRMFQKNPHNLVSERTETTQDGARNIAINHQPYTNSTNDAHNIEKHLLKSLKGEGFAITGERAGDRVPPKQVEVPRSRNLPAHLLTCYYTLRFMRSRENKTKILYTLNYFRAIQKRISIDLREFGTRERIDSHQKEPMSYPQEAAKNVVTQQMTGYSEVEKTRSGAAFNAIDFFAGGKLTVFDQKAIQDMVDMPSVRQYKNNGYFNSQIMQTCPAFPKVHFAFGEATVRETEDLETDHSKKRGGISEKSIKLMGRIDKIELDELTQEVFIKDDFGIYVLYDCCLQDMRALEDHLIRIASYYLMNSEVLQDPHDDKPMPSKDRMQILDDLLCNEASFQFKKVRLVQVYMEAYEHISDPLEQQRLMQIVTDIMARRPRFNLQASYFLDSYEAELALLDKEHELISMLVDTQISLEKTESKSLQDSLCWSYSLANKFEDKKWQYQDAEALLRRFIKQSKKEYDAEFYVKSQMEAAKLHEARAAQAQQELIAVNQLSDEAEVLSERDRKVQLGIYDKELTTEVKKDSKSNLKSQKSKTNDTSQESSGDEEFEENEYFQVNENAFQALLGMPEISLETLYQSYKEKDRDIASYMNENSNFIQVHEGYPEFLTVMQGGNEGSKKARTFQVSPWSQECGNLDFYVSLDFVNRYYCVVRQVQQEFYDVLKPYNAQIMTHIDHAVIDKCITEFRRVRDFLENREIEYKGREYIEDESVMGNSDKMVFLSKEMIAQLTLTAKSALDPYQICKLDIQTIKFFEFNNKVKKDEGKYIMQRQKGTPSSKWLIEMTRRGMIEIAKKRKQVQAMQNKLAGDLAAGFVSTLNQTTRKVEVPSLLQTYCNIMELMRLRNELILARTETQVLEKVYQQQMAMCGLKNIKLYFDESVSFEPISDDEITNINYVDDGPAVGLVIDLAICEFDPKLASNLNFRHPDAFKLCITTSGLEEVRAALNYQLMQKQLLIVATRINQLMIDQHCRAFSELKLVEMKARINVPNPTINFAKVFSKSTDTVSAAMISDVRTEFKQDLSNIGQKGFYNIAQRKIQRRTDWIKEHKKFLNECQKDNALNNQAAARIMRCFKIMIMNRYCNEVFLKIQLDSQKIQAIQACQRLRIISRYLDFDMGKLSAETGGTKEESAQIFKFENVNFMLENWPLAYIPKEFEEFTYSSNPEKVTKVIDPHDVWIHDLFGVPSSLSLIMVDAADAMELAALKTRQKDILKRQKRLIVDDLTTIDARDMYCEDNLKALLPTFTPRELDGLPEQTTSGEQEHEIGDQSLIRKHGHPLLDYEEALNYSQSKYAKLMRYYQHLERIFCLEWFIQKLQFKQSENIFMDTAFETGLPFWHDTDYDARVKKELQPATISQAINPLSQKLLYSRIVSKKQKKDIAEELVSISMIMKNLISKFRDKYFNNREMNYEYLQSYTEFRYMQILASMSKLVQQYYLKPNSAGANAMRCIKESISRITKMDHVKIAYKKGNNYHVNNGIVHPQMQLIDSTNFIPGVYLNDEDENFKRCIRPVINEKAMEPPQITLFQSLYQTDNFRRKMPSQFAGQFISTHNSVSFKTFESALLDMSQEDRQYTQSYIVQVKFQANDFMETAQNEVSMKTMTNEDVYDLQQLSKAKNFIIDTTQPLLLKNAVICWTENTVLPDDPKVYEKYESNFRQAFFWKIIQQKEQIIKSIGAQGKDSGIPSKEKLAKLKAEIQKLQDDFTLATASEEQQRTKMIKLLNEEFTEMKKKVAFDNIYTNKAEIQVLKNEIEKFIVRAATQTLENENQALSMCFLKAVPTIQMHIHPFQQFAATLYDEVDPNSHLDMVTKLNFVQDFITKLRNRGTKVNTLTSGPGMVFTIKDVNECLQEFCRKLLKYGEGEMKSRSDTLFKVQCHYQDLIFKKDQSIKTLQTRALIQQQNITNLINGKLFEKGNQLIYQLDTQSRLLTLFKQNMFSLEREIRTNILGEMSHKITLQQTFVDKESERFEKTIQLEYKNMAQNLQKYEDIFKKYIEDETRKIRELGTDLISNKKMDADVLKSKKTFYPSYEHPSSKFYFKDANNQSQTTSNSKALSNTQVIVKNTFVGAIVPDGFQHKTYCQCYEPNPDYPLPTHEMAALEMMSEQEARMELAQSIAAMQKCRVFWRTKQMFMTQKFQDQINLLKKQLNNNSYLWDQMAEAEKREKILKQELLFTQQSLSSAEKVIEKLQEEMKKLEADRERLAKYKNSKAQRLKDLEDRVKKADVFENIDTEKLINVLGKKDNELRELKDVAKFASNRVENAENQRVKAIKQISKKFLGEQKKTQQVVEKMEQMKLELKMLETNDTSVASIWKRKCLDLFEVCTTLKTENEDLREKCQDLIAQGLQLSDMMQNPYREQSIVTELGPGHSLDDAFQRNNLQLPKLAQQQNGSNYGSQLKPVGNISVGVTSGRHGISTANTYATNPIKGLGITTPQRESQHYEYGSAHGETSVIQEIYSGRQTTNNDTIYELPNSNVQASMNSTTAGYKTQIAQTQDQRNLNLQRVYQKSTQQDKLGSSFQMRAGIQHNAPQTAAQNQRGKSLGSAVQTYNLPNTAGQDRTPQSKVQNFVNQDRKNLNILQILGSEPAQIEQMRRPIQAQGKSPMIAKNDRNAYLPNSKVQKVQQDSLFESSKASTGFHQRTNLNSNMKKSQFSNSFKMQTGLDNSGIIGSRIQPTMNTSVISAPPKQDQFLGSFYIQSKKRDLGDASGKHRDTGFNDDQFVALAQCVNSRQDLTQSLHNAVAVFENDASPLSTKPNDASQELNHPVSK